MRAVRMRKPAGALVAMLVVLPLLAHSVLAVPPGNDAFQRTWAHTDLPVADGDVSRTWMWGPEAFTDLMDEGYTDTPGGTRTVQYFDKSRMEITDPSGDPDSIWYVTNGLLVVELMTGQMQVGNDDFEPRKPAEVNVAGDADDETGPTYATFSGLQDGDALSEGAVITQRVDREGNVTDDPTLAANNVQAAHYVPDTEHTVAAPFWEFMNSTGPVYENGSVVDAALFENAFYATGFPIAEAYWANVKVANSYKDVLMQCFERRCLTYTPDNPPGWQVEAGNVGQHYYTWRYEQDNTPPPEEPEPEPVYRMAYIQRINDGTTFSRTIFTMNSDGTDQRPLGLDPSLFTSIASLSPDGQTIAFTAWDEDNEDIPGTQVYTVGVDGSNLQAITELENGRQPFEIEWSPDGSQIAFTSWESAGSDQFSYIYVISPNGSSETRLTNDGEWVSDVTWSPDGSKLAFISNRECQSCIWIMNADGTEPEMAKPWDGAGLWELDWSPDGSEIAYTAVIEVDGESQARVMLIDVDGTNPRQLVDSTASGPRWDVSGDRLYFTSDRFGDYDIFVVDRDGTNEERLTQGQWDEFNPAPPGR